MSTMAMFIVAYRHIWLSDNVTPSPALIQYRSVSYTPEQVFLLISPFTIK